MKHPLDDACAWRSTYNVRRPLRPDKIVPSGTSFRRKARKDGRDASKRAASGNDSRRLEGKTEVPPGGICVVGFRRMKSRAATALDSPSSGRRGHHLRDSVIRLFQSRLNSTHPPASTLASYKKRLLKKRSALFHTFWAFRKNACPSQRLPVPETPPSVAAGLLPVALPRSPSRWPRSVVHDDRFGGVH